MHKTRIAVALAAVLGPGLILAPVWRLGGLGAGEDDILYYYPMRVFFAETVRAAHAPWFNPWTGLGRPFVADPQTAVWYPFTWLFAVVRPEWAYPAVLWGHYSLALWGMYRLLRLLRLGRPGALFGGVAFAFCGFMLAHRAHFAMQQAAAWTPWVFWALLRYTGGAGGRPGHDGRGAGRKPARLATAAVVLALQCLAGHVQVAAITALGSLVFLLSCARRGAARPGEVGAELSFALPAAKRSFAVPGRWLLAWVCAGGLFAVQWLPTLDYARLCTRVQNTYKDFVENSWHPTSAVGWVLPMLMGQRTPNFFDQPYWGPSHQVEQFAYAGILPLVLAALGLRAGWRGDPRRRPWVVLGVFGLLLALGEYGPLCPLLFRVPGSSLFRVPARALVLVNLAVAALAAVTLDDLGSRLSPQRVRLRAIALRWTKRPRAVAVALVAVPLAAVGAAWPFVDKLTRPDLLHALRPWNSAVWTALVVALLSLLALAAIVRHWRRPGLTWLLVGLTSLDLGVIGWTIDVPAGRRNPAELTTPRGDAEWMQMVRESPHRLWVVTMRRDRLPDEYYDPVEKAAANTNMLRGIAALTDYGPLQPRSVVERFGFAPWGETWATDELLSDTRWMRLYNVGWILLCDGRLPAPADCEPAAVTAEGWRLYRNPSAAGWALLEDADQPGAVRFERQIPSAFTTWVDTWSPATRSTSRAAAPRQQPRLVISQLALPGWTARIGNHPVPIETVDGVLAAVRVPPGQAVEITWSYFPPGLLAGAVATALSALVLAGAALWSVRRRTTGP
jgi:hypothetical protein